MSSTIFDYDMFLTLSNSALVAYMEPLLAKKTITISKEALQQLSSSLTDYDEHHLVYALQLGMDHAPEFFALRVPPYLAHEKGSVYCTAYNTLSSLPDELITQEVIDSVQKILSSYPVKEIVKSILERLKEKKERRRKE